MSDLIAMMLDEGIDSKQLSYHSTFHGEKTIAYTVKNEVLH